MLCLFCSEFDIALREFDGLWRSFSSCSPFYQNYAVSWGGSLISATDRGREIQLSLDQTTGSGFSSNQHYGSGFFHMKIKLHQGDSAGVVTAFYLSSVTNNHDEVDFEFLGNREGKPLIVQTNIFTNGYGNREQQFRLWFDPTTDFHDYRILWNPYQIVFFVDQYPIRIFKNNTNIGVGYPSQSMKIMASIWNGEDWATDGGKVKIDWSKAPFTAKFQGFNIYGCSADRSRSEPCCSPAFWWNSNEYSGLTSAQRRGYEIVRKKFMTYDYCKDTTRHSTPPPECFR